MGTSLGPITIIADDLTGACDAAVPFAAAGEVVRVGLGDRLSAAGSVRAISTNTRDVPADQAEARIRGSVDEIGNDAGLFKKIDSVFRGNTIVEICAAMRHWRFDLAVIAPAYPALGRTLRDGVLWIKDTAGEQTVPVEHLLTAAGVSVKRIARGGEGEIATAMRGAIAEGRKAVLCDAAAQSDLECVVGAARSLQKRVLWIGSGGLAHALAGEMSAPVHAERRRRGQVLYFVGSQHAVTSAQVECLRSAETGSGTVVNVAMGETTEDEIRRAVAGLTAERIGCLFVTGGDTALFVCRALGVESVRLEREFAQGVPLGRVEGGPMDGVMLALKSGGFGEPNLMCRLLEEFGMKQEVTA